MVRDRHTPYVLTRGSRAEAVLVPYEDFLRYQQIEEREVLTLLDRCLRRMERRNAEVPDEEIVRDVSHARR